MIPTTGYHITYANRVPSIIKHGLLLNITARLKTGAGVDPGVFFVVSPKLAKWSANDRGLDNSLDWVILRANNLDKKHIVADPDYGDSPQESIKYGGTFAYNADVSPKLLSVLYIAQGTNKERHDEFESFIRNYEK